MGKRLRLAQGLADGILNDKEMEEALSNPMIVQEAEKIVNDRDALKEKSTIRKKKGAKING